MFRTSVVATISVLGCGLALAGSAAAAGATTTSQPGAQAVGSDSVKVTWLSGSTTASSQVVSPENDVLDDCGTLPGETCVVTYTVGVGTSQISFLFSDGEDITGPKKNCVAPYKACTYTAYGIPNSEDVSAILFHINGTNVRVNSITGEL